MAKVKRTLKDPPGVGRLDEAEIRSVIGAVHVVPIAAGGWQVRATGRQRFVEIFEREDAAVEFGRKISRKRGTDLIVHGRQGEIRRFGPERP